MKKCSNRANDIVVFVYFIALSELFEDGPLALSGSPVVTAYTLLNAIGKFVVCKYHELSFPRSDFPHWLKSNSAPTYRCNVILCRHISEAVYCYFFNGTTRPIIII